ncbi:MAG TPA: glycosyltransferase family 39 protein [Pseudomonadales bacterium]|nr:glycosyltransferase family 39 protein [Pseudomonadales bacterium]
MMKNDEIIARSPANETDRSRQKREWLPAIVLIVCLVAFVIKAVTSLMQESATWDETAYFGLGKYLMQYHRWDAPGAVIHPPLSYYIHDLPLLFYQTDQSVVTNFPSVTNAEAFALGSNLRGQALLASPANQGDHLLILSRLMMVLTAVLLGCVVYVWSYSLYGKWSAMLAIILFSFSPTILADARLITPDITLATFSFITVFFFWRLLNRNRMGDVILGGICLGLALLSKHTSVLLLPICFLLAVIWWIKQKTLKWSYCLMFIAIGVEVLFLGYGMHPGPYFAGISIQRASEKLHEEFLVGQYSNHGWWYYYIVVFLIKTPLATMFFLALAFFPFLRRARTGTWMNEMFLLVPAAVIFCFFSLSHASIGMRYIMPIYPFLFVFASGCVPTFLTNKWLAGLSVVMAGWYIGASCYIHPHYLAYFNELIGGPDNGYKYLVDCNLDWGQDLKGLKSYMQEHDINRINLSYFGTDSPARYGISYNWLPSCILANPEPGQEPPTNGWFAISATDLQGLFFADKNLFAQFKDAQPVAKIGYSIFVYKVGD